MSLSCMGHPGFLEHTFEKRESGAAGFPQPKPLGSFCLLCRRSIVFRMFLMGLFTMSEWHGGLFPLGQRKSQAEVPVLGSICALHSTIVSRNPRRSWGFRSQALASAWLGSPRAAGSVCLCWLLLPRPSWAAVARTAAPATRRPAACSLGAVAVGQLYKSERASSASPQTPLPSARPRGPLLWMGCSLYPAIPTAAAPLPVDQGFPYNR